MTQLMTVIGMELSPQSSTDSPTLHHRNIDQHESDTNTYNVRHKVTESTSLVGHTPGDTVVLRRQIGIIGCIYFTVGTVIGSGIFVSPKGILENTGMYKIQSVFIQI